MNQSPLLSLFVVLLACTLACASNSAEARPDHTAKAVFTGEDSTDRAQYTTEDQANKVVAASAALQTCRIQNATSPQSCELTQLDGKALTTSQDIKNQLPTGDHPLFLWLVKSRTAAVFLAGSVHILKPGLYPLATAYQEAFDQANYLVVEVDLNALSPQQMQSKALSYAALPQGQTLPQVLPAALYKKLEAVTNEYGLPLAQMANFKPSFISQQLALLAFVSAGYDPNAGVESHFTRQLGDRKVLQLETIDLQLDLLMNQPMATQIAMLQDTLDQIDSIDRIAADMVTAYLAGDEAGLDTALREQTGSSPEAIAFMHKLMDERNVGMVDKIEGYLKSNGVYFVLIGSGHYVGSNNIIQLMEERGYTLRQVNASEQVKVR